MKVQSFLTFFPCISANEKYLWLRSSKSSMSVSECSMSESDGSMSEGVNSSVDSRRWWGLDE